jgi:hypothetical protein
MFDQRLNHFASTTRTFRQRYFVEETHYDHKPTSPIIVYVGGEAELTSHPIRSGPIVEVAAETKALILGLEHRFFGRSHPFPFLNTTSLRYLTVDQGLADLEYFISSMRQIYCNNSICDVLVVGGSYAGSMSSWFRLYYPHVANYSWASSGPLRIERLFPEYDYKIGSILKNYSEDCYVNSKLLLSRYHRAFVHHDQEEIWHIIMRFRMDPDMHPASILTILSDGFSYPLQYNDNYRLIASYCNRQSQSHIPNEEAFVELFESVLRISGTTVKELDPFWPVDESSESDAAAARCWSWITCNELGWFSTSAGFQSPWINMSYYQAVCRRLFGVGPGDFGPVSSRYGGTSPKSTYVVFSQGAADPWSTLGVQLIDESNAQRLFLIDGASHCSDLHAELPTDSEALKKSRQEIVKKLSGWLSRECDRNCLRGQCLHDRCLCDVGWSGEYCTFEVVYRGKFWIIGMAALMMPLLILITVGGSAWWLFRRIQEDQFLLSLHY